MNKRSVSVGYSVVKRESEDSTTEHSTEIQVGGARRFQSIVDTNYRKPKNGTLQDNMTKSEIKKRLVGYKSLKTPEAKRYLLTLTPFKTWIKYYNIKTKQFRTGGLLMKVDSELRYVMLVNTSNNITWSVQLNDNIIFVPDPEQHEMSEHETEKERKEVEKTKEKLYNLYVRGRLKKV